MTLTETLDYGDGDSCFEAYIAQPEGAASARPCVVLTHDWSGFNQGMRAIARRVAGLGYTSFGLDVYGKGIRGDEAGDNDHLMAPLMADRGLLRERLLLGLRTAREHPAVDGRRMIVLGYCFGGLCALDLARAAPKGLLGCLSVHGALDPPAIGPQVEISARVLILHGWADPVVPPEKVLAVAEELTAAGADWQLHGFGHAMHAFTVEGLERPDLGIGYHPPSAARAWAMTRRFLAEVFGD